MSTTFYPFRNTISCVRLAFGAGHDVLGVWQKGAKTGELVLTKGTGKTVMMLFRSDEPAFHVTYGGKGVGVVVTATPRGQDMDLTEYVLSENGELFTVDQVLDGHGGR